MKINHLLGARVIVQGIKGKIASRSIIAQGAVDIVTQNPPVLVGLMSLIRGRPKGRCLDHLAAKDHMHEFKAAANNKGTAKKRDRKSTRLNSSHVAISYAVFCLKTKSIPIQKTS